MATLAHLGSKGPCTISRRPRARQLPAGAAAVVCLAGLAAIAARAGAQTADAESPAPSKNKSQLFPPKMVVGRAFFLPTVSYAEERGFGVGGEVLVPFRLPGNTSESHPSEVRGRGQVTVKGQAQLELEAVAVRVTVKRLRVDSAGMRLPS